MSSSADQARQQKLSGSPPAQSALAYMAEDQDARLHPPMSTSPRNGPMSAPVGPSPHLPDRPNFPTRASTVSSPHDLESRKLKSFDQHHAHSEDLNHGSFNQNNDLDLSAGPSGRPTFSNASRPTTPSASASYAHAAPDGFDPQNRRAQSADSESSESSSNNDTGPTSNAAPSTAHTSSTSVASS